ncbi:unnamed protein product, partial [Symbiodinium pilosum]
AIETNSFFVELHLDERKLLKSINLSPTNDSGSVTASIATNSSYAPIPSSSPVATNSMHPKPMTIRQFVSWSTSEHTLDPEAFASKLREVYVELDPVYGLHA